MHIRDSINHRLILSSTNTSHETGGPKSTHQSPGGSIYDCLMLVPKEKRQKYNRHETIGSTYDRIMFVLKKIRHVRTQNKITAPSISKTYKTYIMKKCNGLNRNYVDITKICRHQNAMEGNT